MKIQFINTNKSKLDSAGHVAVLGKKLAEVSHIQLLAGRSLLQVFLLETVFLILSAEVLLLARLWFFLASLVVRHREVLLK